MADPEIRGELLAGVDVLMILARRADQHRRELNRGFHGFCFRFVVCVERPHAARSDIRVAAGVREIEKWLLVAIRSLRMIERKK